MKVRHFNFLSTVILFCFSCSSPEKNKANVQSPAKTETITEKIIQGKVLNNFKIKSDTSQSYALYLPSYYLPKRVYPIIYFFDPQGKGVLPVTKYKSLGEKYGYILVGCNNSQNGMEWDQTTIVVENLFNDTKMRFSIDPHRIYTGGFSGGARVAGNVAVLMGGINGVVSCGAGLGTDQQPQQKFSFLGIAGNEDFNYTELKGLDKLFENAGWTHFFLEFNGKHEWPDIGTMEDAFRWLDFNAMRDGVIAKSDSLIGHFVGENQKLNKDIFSNYLACKKTEAFVKGLTNDESFEKELKKYQDNEELKRLLKHMDDLETKESAMKNAYMEALQTKNDSWWKTAVQKLNTEIKTLRDKQEVLVRKRILNYLSLAVYMGASNAIKAGDMAGADHFVSVYKLVDPKNSYHAYLQAIVFARRGEQNNAIASLSEAVKLGFEDHDKMRSEKEFTELNGRKEFNDLLKRVKENSLRMKNY